jgi:hypothetical protein
VSPRDRPTGVGFTVGVGCTCAGIGSRVFACGGGGTVGSEVGGAFDNAHPGTTAIINGITMSFWKDFMAFLWFLSYVKWLPVGLLTPSTIMRFPPTTVLTVQTTHPHLVFSHSNLLTGREALSLRHRTQVMPNGVQGESSKQKARVSSPASFYPTSHSIAAFLSENTWRYTPRFAATVSAKWLMSSG